MLALREYGSDSEHSEDDRSVTEDIGEDSSKNMPADRKDSSKNVSVESVDSSKFVSAEKGDSSKNVVSDFFGMFRRGSASSTLRQDKNLPALKEKKKVLGIKVEDDKKITAEIPSSSFWSDADTDQLQVWHQSSKYDGRNFEQSNMLNRKQTGNKDISSQQKRTFYNNSGPSYPKRQMTSKQSETAVSDEREISVTCKTIEKRKMFFIHPRILPLIHGKRKKCATPQNKEWDNPGHAGSINRLKWNVPSYSNLLVTASMDSSIKIWNVWSQLDPCVQVLSAHSKAVRDVDWKKDGKQLLSCSYDKSARLWDIEAGVCSSVFHHNCFVTCCKYHPVDHHLVVTGGNNQIQTWDCRVPSAPCKTLKYKDDIGQIQDIVITGDGSTLFSCTDLVSRDSADRNLMAWDLHTGVVLSNQIYQERFTLNRLQMHPTDDYLLAQSKGDYIAQFSLHRPYKINKHKRFEGHKVQGYNIGFDVSPDGQVVYSGSADGKIYCYNYQSGKQWHRISSGLSIITDVACHPVLPSTLATSSWDGTVQVWR